MKFEDLLIQCGYLRDELSKSPEIKAVEEAQKATLDDLDVICLINDFQTAQDRYNEAVKYKLDTQNEYIKQISITKAALYSHPLVLAYNEALKKANAMLDEVTSLIFDDLIIDFNPSEENSLLSHCVVNK